MSLHENLRRVSRGAAGLALLTTSALVPAAAHASQPSLDQPGQGFDCYTTYTYPSGSFNLTSGLPGSDVTIVGSGIIAENQTDMRAASRVAQGVWRVEGRKGRTYAGRTLTVCGGQVYIGGFWQME